MRTRIASIVICLALAMAALPAVGKAAEPSSSDVPAHVAGRALVGAGSGNRAAARQAIEARGGRVRSYYEPGDFFVVETPTEAPSWVGSIRNDRSIRFAELDYILTADTHLDSTTPNDTRFGDLYGMQNISAEQAWDEQTGSASVVVGVIDSGVDYNHVDLNDNMWTGTNGVHGRDCRNDDDDPMDDNGHGTHVAGTIGAEGNNGTGVVGVNWDVSIMALKFLSSSGSGSTSDAIECLDFANKNGAHLTSNSWGGGGYSQALYDAIKRARDGHDYDGNGSKEGGNMLFVAAAGNDGDNNDEVYPHYPSNYDLDNVVSVAATDSNDALASWSNYGAMTVDLAAPGVGILSTIPGNKYDTYSGTSMATPHVAGAAALVLAEFGTSASYGAVLDRVYGSVDRNPPSGLVGKVATGGRLNVAKAVENDTAPPGAPGSLTAGSPTAGSLTLTWTAPDEDGATVGAVSSYRLRYRSGSGPWATVPTGHPLAPGAAEALTVGGLRPGTSYEFELVAKDNVGQMSTATTTGSTAAGDVVFFDDTDPAKSGWSADSPWAVTSERPHSETQGWSDSPGANTTDPGDPYADSKDLSLYSPSTIDLSAATNPKLSLWQHYQLEKNYDFGYIYCNKDGGSWNQLGDRLHGAKGYHSVVLDLSPCAGSSNVKLRFRLVTDRSVTFDGWYIDNVLVRADSTALAISNLAASPNPFSPNPVSDGSKDYTDISFSMNKSASWQVTISNSTTGFSCTTPTSTSSTTMFRWYGGSGADCSGTGGVAEGTYSVTVTANDGTTTAGAGPISVGVDLTDPTAAITSPTGGQTVSGTIDITADASDGVGMQKVDFYVDGALVGSDTSGFDGWSTSWNTTTVANGTHTFTAIATDTAGNTTTSSPVTVDVSNTASTISVESVTYSTTGGRNNNNHLLVTVRIMYGTNPAASANVSATVFRNSSAYWSGSGTTDSNGYVTFKVNNYPSGCYTTTVNSVVYSGQTYSPGTPTNGHCK